VGEERGCVGQFVVVFGFDSSRGNARAGDGVGEQFVVTTANA